ncbi:MAG TPA: glycosyltransferase family 2 protein [Thermoleophilaceae bacterium]|jgi:GT2 family glycosyltransferase
MTVEAHPPVAPRTGRPGAQLRISVVICAFTLDRWDELRASVASVLDQTHPPHEVLVAVDHDAALLERARAELAGPGVQVVESEGAPGLSGARNTGVRRAGGEVVAFVDDDARADRRWLETLARVHADPDVLGTGGMVEPVWPGPPPSWLPPELYWVVGCSYRGLPTTVAPVRAPIGANMSFAREAVERAGGFAEDLGRLRDVPGSCEDTELSLRVQRTFPGRPVLFVPGARVEHVVAPARTSWRYLRWRCWTEGRAKAELTRAAGPGPGLSDERRYVARVLPRAFARGLVDALRGDRGGLARSAAIVAALTLTAAGYLYGLATRAPRREDWA